jgi:hypothetical protein
MTFGPLGVKLLMESCHMLFMKKLVIGLPNFLTCSYDVWVGSNTLYISSALFTGVMMCMPGLRMPL